MDPASEELKRRGHYLSSLIRRTKLNAKVVVEEKEVKEGDGKGKEERKVSVRVRAADMPVVLQRRAIRLAYDDVSTTLRADGKRLALALKK
uniref:Uncharacterized protein n=1 Tax=Triticum urartu TaxID=4572 RepID=A0A8R7QQ25_TRIUA